MPLYDYECRGCRHHFEALVRSTDPPPSCPECKSEDLERLPSAASMSSDERTRTLVSKERKLRLPKHQGEQREEFQKTLKEHLEHEQH
jgi:putative FmdB family regulatory protein